MTDTFFILFLILYVGVGFILSVLYMIKIVSKFFREEVPKKSFFKKLLIFSILFFIYYCSIWGLIYNHEL